MRKIATCILMGVLLFNCVGYRLLFDYLQSQSDLRLEARLDLDNYDESQLTELKIPLNIPYQNTWSHYERCDGEVEVNGILYKYVKRKVQNDTLYVQVIPNNGKMDLQVAKNDVFRSIHDISTDNNAKKSPGSQVGFKASLSDFIQHNSFCYSIVPPDPSRGSFTTYPVKSLPPSHQLPPGQPPDLS